MPASRKIIRGVWGVLLTLFGLSVLAMLLPHETLMRQATRLTAWEPCQEAGWQNNASYWWLSDHEALFLSIQPASEDPRNYTAIRYDTRTNTRTHLSALEQEMFTHRGNIRASGWQVSPDGKYLLWNGSDTVAGTNPATGQPISTFKERWYVTSLDDAHANVAAPNKRQSPRVLAAG